MRQKLKDAHGETIIEVLVSILVAALSVALLFSALMAASRLNHLAQEKDEGFYGYLNDAWEQESEVITGETVTIKNSPSASTSTKVDVTFYGGKGILSYKEKASASP